MTAEAKQTITKLIAQYLIDELLNTEPYIITELDNKN